jgi:hypothetical protein
MRKAHVARVDVAVAGRGKDFDRRPQVGEKLAAETAAWEQQRNTPAARIKWSS